MTKPTSNPHRLSREDTRAMARAIELFRIESRDNREQIDTMIKEDGWEAAGRFAAYACQDHALKLKPWEVAPCHINDLDGSLQQPADDHRGLKRAATLLKRLLESGCSRFEPNPLAALAGKGPR